MGAKRTQYQIVGRYMDGKEVTGYHLQSLESGKQGKYTREQVIYLVGRDQITNCEGQLYQDKVLLRGKGISLEDLPVQQEKSGQITNTNNIGHIRRGTSADEAMTQFMLVGKITDGSRVTAYIIQNAGGGKTQVDKATVLELAKNGRLGNARLQLYNGKPILKGVNCDLSQLPKISK